MAVRFKADDLVEIIANNAGHGWANGTRLKVKNVSGGYVYFKELDGTDGRWTAALNDVRLVGRTRADIEKELAQAEATVATLKTKIEFMNEVGGDTYEEDEFLAYEALGIVEGEGNKLDKAKALARLIRSGKL
ncbi:MAG TPA: hypothetical protein VFK94_06575 [Patescibacteria group bacterium]|nr:hypothetical protein [Patescibacteria group bacterium]